MGSGVSPNSNFHIKKLWGSIWGGVGCRIDRSARLGVLVGCGRAILKKFSHNATPSIYIKVEGNDEDWIWFLRKGCTSQSLATEPRKLYRIFCCLCIHWWHWLTCPFLCISYIWIREGVKKRFFGRSFQIVGGWGGWFPNKVQTPQNHPENRLFRPEFHLSFSKISQKPWVGWVGKQIWEKNIPKKLFF